MTLNFSQIILTTLVGHSEISAQQTNMLLAGTVMTCQTETTEMLIDDNRDCCHIVF